VGGQKKFSGRGRLCGGGSGPHVEHNSTPFNSLQSREVDEPDATRSLSLEVSSLTSASSLLDDACMYVPRETVDVVRTPEIFSHPLFHGRFLRETCIFWSSWALRAPSDLAPLL